MDIIRRRINTKLSFVFPLYGTYTSTTVESIEIEIHDPIGNEVLFSRSFANNAITITIPSTCQRFPGYYSLHIAKKTQTTESHVDFENFLELTGCNKGECESGTINMPELKFIDETCMHIHYGSSSGIPAVNDGNILSSYQTTQMQNSVDISIASTASQKRKCHFVMWPHDHNCTITSWKDSEGDDIKSLIQYADICHYRVAYLLSNAYIVNTSNIKITITQ